MVDSLRLISRVMAQWYNPCMVPKDLEKGLGFKAHWCASKSLVNLLPLSLTWGCQHLVRLGMLLCLTNNHINKEIYKGRR